MKKLIEAFMKKNVFADLLAFSVVLIGILSVFAIRREVFPNVVFDVVTVTTIYPGATPEESEQLITNPIEQDMKEVDGIKRLTSISTENRSYVVAQLDPDQTTEKDAKDDIDAAVDRFERPEGAEEPLVVSVKSKQSPIVEVSVSSDLGELELRKLAKEVEKELEKIPGVARVVTRGVRDVEIHVEADLKKLSRYRLSLEDLIFALKNQNVSVPGGTVEVSPTSKTEKEKSVRTVGQFKTIQDVESTVVRANDVGASIFIKDVANVSEKLERAEFYNHTNGKPSLSLTVLKKEKSDAIRLVKEVKKRVSELELQFEKKVAFSFINDLSLYIERRLSVLSGNLALGLFLVIFILSMILPLKVALICSMGIPIGFLGAMIFFYQNDLGLNLISLIGFIIVSGMLVDDAIVVTDNAVRLIEEGVEPEEAALRGTSEIWVPVANSSFTTMIAFLPMMFMSGIFGKFVYQIPLAVIVCLIVSLLEAFFILPSHLGRWLTEKDIQKLRNKSEKKKGVLNQTKYFWDEKVIPFYEKFITRALSKKYWMSGLGLVLFVVTILVASTVMKFVLFPPDGVEIFFIRGEAKVGTSLEQMKLKFKPIEDRLLSLPEEEVDDFVTYYGLIQQDPNDPNTKRGSHVAQIAVYLSPESKRTRVAQEIIDDLKKNIQTPEGLDRLSFDRVNPGPPVGKPVSIGLQGEDVELLKKASKDLQDRLSKIPGVSDLTTTFTEGKKEIQVHLKPQEAAAAKVSAQQIGSSVRAAYEGIVATKIQKLDEEVQVRVLTPKQEENSEKKLQSIMIPNSLGNLIPLPQVSYQKEIQSLSIYEHEDYERQIRVQGELNTQVMTATDVVAKIQEQEKEFLASYPGVKINFGGEADDTQESMQSLFRAFGIAALGIFLLLVFQFQNLTQPLVILITVPFGVMSVILAFALHGKPLSFMGMLGIIALSGVIVNNAIVYVSFVNDLRKQAMDKVQSLIQAAKMRLRPIFLTSVTTIAGLLPTAYGWSGEDKFVVPIALALSWGLFIGSFLTAVFLPIAVSVLDDVAALPQRWKQKK